MPGAEDLTPEERKEMLRKHYSELGKKGAAGKWAKLNKEERSKIMSKTAKIRWAKVRKLNKENK